MHGDPVPSTAEGIFKIGVEEKGTGENKGSKQVQETEGSFLAMQGLL
jgi:hypothetical protein